MEDKSQSQQAGILVLGKILATISEAVVPMVIARIMGKADVGALMAILMIYSSLATILSVGFPETLLNFLPKNTKEERRARALKIIRCLFTVGLICSLFFLILPILSPI